MSYYTGIDVSLEVSHFCFVDSAGKIVKETRMQVNTRRSLRG